MNAMFLKAGMGVFLVWLTAQMGTLTEEILAKVRESVQASELLLVDGHLGVWAIEQRRTRGPRDQAEFETALRQILSARGRRDVTQDRWDNTYLYQLLGDNPVSWRITSKGGDHTLGTDDDIIVERVGDNTQINRDPVEIAEAAIALKQAHDAEVIRRLRQLAEDLEGEGAAGDGAPPAQLEPPQVDLAEILQEQLSQIDRLLAE